MATRSKTPATSEADMPAEASEQPQETTDRASLGDPRTRPPQAPTGLIGWTSKDTAAKITLLLQNAQVMGRQHKDAWEAASNAVQLVQTHRLHPLVAKYKAEALCYLRGKMQQAQE